MSLKQESSPITYYAEMFCISTLFGTIARIIPDYIPYEQITLRHGAKVFSFTTANIIQLLR